MYLVRSATVVYSLGEGLRGYQGVLHGGMFSVLIDESVGSYLALNRDMSNRAVSRAGQLGAGEMRPGKKLSRLAGFWNTTALTVGMSVRFLKAVALPCVVLVRSSLVRIEGRKIVIESVVETEKGGRHATCESTWVTVPLAMEYKM
ncbi:Thioesterase superfamily [Microdochium nivale]|nr:Thioesterase superfamily [Microdochium nivale]